MEVRGISAAPAAAAAVRAVPRGGRQRRQTATLKLVAESKAAKKTSVTSKIFFKIFFGRLDLEREEVLIFYGFSMAVD